MPVLMSYLPVPSRLMAAAMRVSLVARDTNARRPPLPGVVRGSGSAALGEAFLPGRPGGPFLQSFRLPVVHTGTRGRTVERDARQNDAQKHDQTAQHAGSPHPPATWIRYM